MKFQGNKVVPDDATPQNESAVAANMKQCFAAVISALEACEREVRHIEEEAHARAAEIISAAQKRGEEIRAKTELFDAAVKSTMSKIANG
jgi:Skp family chaperone for outer membrane proteins